MRISLNCHIARTNNLFFQLKIFRKANGHLFFNRLWFTNSEIFSKVKKSENHDYKNYKVEMRLAHK